MTRLVQYIEYFNELVIYCMYLEKCTSYTVVVQKLIGKMHGAISTTNVHKKMSTFVMVNIRCSIFGSSI
jgi:hypothetical protein